MRTLAILALVGCGSSHAPGFDSGVDAPFERCARLEYDANRYHFIAPALPQTWAQAYGACGAFGMELVSVDDLDEYDHDASLQTPYWIGTNYSDEGLEALDGCPPYFMWASGEPATMDLNTCVYRGLDGMHEIACDGSGMTIGASCETPRLNQTCATMGSSYVTGDDHRKAEAETTCRAKAGYVVEVNSSAELQRVVDKFPSQNDFWIGATFNGVVFTDTTGCPEVFGWAPGEPVSSTGMCVAYTRGLGMRMRNCSEVVGTICETN